MCKLEWYHDKSLLIYFDPSGNYTKSIMLDDKKPKKISSEILNKKINVCHVNMPMDSESKKSNSIFFG